VKNRNAKKNRMKADSPAVGPNMFQIDMEGAPLIINIDYWEASKECRGGSPLLIDLKPHD